MCLYVQERGQDLKNVLVDGASPPSEGLKDTKGWYTWHSSLTNEESAERRFQRTAC